MSIVDLYKKETSKIEKKTYTLEEYFKLCKNDKMAYASAAERMLAAIGDAELVDTSKDPRLSRIFQNRTVRMYKAFKDFYGLEDTIESIVGYFRHSAQGLEERKQILYLLGPVGGGKSSLAERLKELMELNPIYVLCTEEGEVSPVFESPLGLFQTQAMRDEISKEFSIEQRYFKTILSPWALKRLEEFDDDISKFRVIRLMPSKLKQIAVMKTEPGDENNQDISTLVGKVDIRKLEDFSQNDADAYSFSGGLCRSNQGILDFVEMFKAPIKVLHPLLTATQEGNYIGTEAIPAIPYQGIILAHSNQSEWQTFKNNKNNEAFLDRICVIKVPYSLRVDDEKQIYTKMIKESGLTSAPCAPQTVEMMAQFSILTRLKKHDNSTLYSKLRVYNGENIRELDPKAKTIQEYRDVAGVDEGMDGISTRFAFKILSQTYNFNAEEVAADPVHLMYILEQTIKKEQFAEEKEKEYLSFVKAELASKYAEFIGDEIQKAYLESYSDFGQNLFNRYLSYADAWVQDIEFKDPDTGLLMSRTILNEELEKMEKPAGISNPKDFRYDVVGFCLRAKAKTGKEVVWTSYDVLRNVIEKRMFTQVEDLLPVISFEGKKDKELEKKHNNFVERMKERGYTHRQVQRLCEWYMRVRKSS
ncbi:MAG TPA: PrkA family serine protein kinase [Candidatus Glassbacteria bacterium]|nr:PrkA family serine protein kinase [Candidatus Glassbacteria bacterium]